MNIDLTPYYKNGPGWSSMGGKYWIRDGFIYWHDGQIGDLSKGQGPATTMPGGYSHDEDYSQWTPEHRAKIIREHDENRMRYEMERADKYARNNQLVESARKKITSEEFNAILEHC